jgi:uncharacterized membrane protein (DUF2068 family)
MENPRAQLDRLFAFDAGFSVIFGSLSLIAPHGLLTWMGGGSYNHSVHETLRYVRALSQSVNQSISQSVHVLRWGIPITLFSTQSNILSFSSTYSRLYGCLRLACGWILWHARAVDDGRFRKHICEALFVCYVLQALAVMRAQFTDRHVLINWIAILLLTILASAYGSFRFRKGGNLIKIYELPTGSNLR